MSVRDLNFVLIITNNIYNKVAFDLELTIKNVVYE